MSRRLGSVTLALACVALLAACEGPEGPAGPAGPAGAAGAAGPAGPTGPAGADANENCTQCHTADVGLFAKQIQYQQSTHALGGNFDRSGASCGGCHTSQGFTERSQSGDPSLAAGVEDPAPINCRTCHMIHETGTSADYALTSTNAFALYNKNYADGADIDVDFGEAAGNLCAKCHQGRTLASRVLDGMVPQLGGADVEITSTRYGLHHGPQAQVLAGVSAYEFTGANTIDGGPASHGDPAANERLCATCHMATASGVEFGGHTWRMSFTSNGDKEENVAGCNSTGCHSNFEDFAEFGDVPTEILGLMMDLEVLLVNAGIKAGLTPGYTIHELEPYAVAGVWSAELAAAMLNWQLFAEDRSFGLHNPAYARAVLENTIEAITP